ncbi:MAG: amidohydrolase [Bacteroidetes bacterium]|nr:amidohydrolase [Bacteroidota bacterium]
MTDLIALRHTLHQHPERSGKEQRTSTRIATLLKETHPRELYTGIAGHGILVHYGHRHQPGILLRAELDALPIRERSELPHASAVPGTAHLCGHDGHMSILVGVAERLAQRQDSLPVPVTLLFQPAEETGQGAAACLADQVFDGRDFDMVFALHNIPGYDEGTVLLREGSFAMASVGMDAQLSGQTSHAAEPQRGNSPVPALIDLAELVMTLPDTAPSHDARAITTIIHLLAGSEAFGTTPGDARLLATLRSDSDSFLSVMKGQVEEELQKLQRLRGLETELQWKEEFPATVNDARAVAMIAGAAEQCGMSVETLSEPFPWSEDFAHFSSRWPGALFGLGSGTAQPHLHSGYYDFPDALIEPAVELWARLLVK